MHFAEWNYRPYKGVPMNRNFDNTTGDDSSNADDKIMY